MTRRLTAMLLVSALLAVSALGCGAREDPPHIVFLLIDTLRKDHVGTYGYSRETTPIIDRLAADGLVFDAAIAQASWTLPSALSLLTSTYVVEFAPQHFYGSDGDAMTPNRATDRLRTLAEMLTDAGYITMHVATNLLFTENFNVTQGFQVAEFQYNAPADWVVDRAIEQLDTHVGTNDQPLFMYLHFMDVHGPREAPPPYRTMFSVLGSKKIFLRHPKELLRFARFEPQDLDTHHFRLLRSYALATYDASLRFVDAQIGRLVDHLKSIGIYENSIIVVVSDHGEAPWDRPLQERALGLHHFLEKDLFGVGHGHTLFKELIDVPLVLHGRGVPRGRIPQQVRNLDILPTLLALANVPAPDDTIRGVDVVSRWQSGALSDLPALSETRTNAAFQRSIQDSAYQYMRLDERELLFDKRAPEPIDLAAQRPDLLARYRQQLDELLSGLEAQPGTPVDLDDETRNRLRDLGYVE